MTRPLKLIFMGTPDIAVPTLSILNESSHVDVCLVVSMPDRPSGRGKKLKSPEVITFAKEESLKTYQTEKINKDEKLKSLVEETEPDLIIVFAFAQFLNSFFLDIPKLGCFNIHTSLLPRYRGAAPIQYAILNGDDQTGVSIQRMVKKMDAGDIIHSKSLIIDKEETSESLYSKLKKLSSVAMSELIEKLIQNTYAFSKQDENNVSFAPTIKKEDGLIDFQKESAALIHRKLKAFTPWPGIFCYLNGKRMKILNVQHENKKLASGELFTEHSSLIIGCAEGTLRLKQVQLEGKKACSDQELLNGLKNKHDSFSISNKATV